jgi:two-component system OmpR family sensor kinase
VYFVGQSGLSPPIDEVAFGQAPKGTEARLDWNRLAHDDAQTLDLKLSDGTSTIAAAAGVRYGGELIGAIVVARPVRTINASTLVQGRRFVPPLLLAFAAAALVALLLSRRITRPVRELTEASERIALGDYDVHLASKGPDELGQLALRFEQMARQLKEASEHERNFLMRISHELRTPLTAIQGHVQAIADGVIDGEEERQASLEIVLAEAGRLQRLIGDLLDLARLETRKFSLNVEEVGLFDVCERAAGAQREEARGRRVELHVHAGAKPVVVGDGDRILQIVSNLVSNALQATPAGGEVAVDVAIAEGVGQVVVSDTGPGIPEEQRASILRPFVTSDVRHGIGLGLPVASELAQAMRGTLVVGERPGGGAAFTLSLPLATGSGRAAGPARSALESTEPASELVAE